MNEHVKKIKTHHDAHNKVPGYDQWDIERIDEYISALFERSRFKVGDRVKIATTPVITDKISWGWIGYKAKLVQGAAGTVHDLDYYKGKFRYGISFDFNNGDGTFTFNEECLEPEGRASKCKICGAHRE